MNLYIVKLGDLAHFEKITILVSATSTIEAESIAVDHAKTVSNTKEWSWKLINKIDDPKAVVLDHVYFSHH